MKMIIFFIFLLWIAMMWNSQDIRKCQDNNLNLVKRIERLEIILMERP